ncbi:MAG TPA: phage major capsid protein, partial [Stellaceae bacterium]|nr:phage major capsid protein [Stellaceae bacterium]
TFSSKLILVPNQLLQDSAFNLTTWLAGKLGVRIARALNRKLTVGSGAKEPTGVMNVATLGVLCPTGETTTVTADDLMDLEHSVDPAYRANAVWMLADPTLKGIKKLKDGAGRYLWTAGLAEGEPGTILGHTYVVNPHMPLPAANAQTIAFGDFSNYFIRRVRGMQVLRLTERYADFNQTGFLAFQRWDGNLVDAGTHPVKYLQQSAS